MRICENCGAHLDAGEKCDCVQERSMADMLAEADTKEAAEIMAKLPTTERRVAAALVRGYALAVESGMAG